MADDTFYEKAYDLEEHETKAFYAKWAATYDHEIVDENGYLQPVRCGDALERFVPDRSTPVLDLGCGTGLVGAELRRRGYESIVGCDYSPEMLAQAGMSGAYGQLLEVDLNRHPLPFEPGSHGAICAVGIFSFGHVHADLVDEMVRLLPRDGVFVVGVNEVWWAEGSLATKIDEVESSGAVTIELRELGGHVPSHDVQGWVIVGRKN